MIEGKKRIKDYVSYEENPTTLRNKIIGLGFGAKDLDTVFVNDETGEWLETGRDKSQNEVVRDGHQHIKLFRPAQTEIIKLNSSGLAVLSYVFSILKKWKDEVFIDVEGFSSFYNSISDFEGKDGRMVYYRGILNLLKYEMIYKKVGEGNYFININMFFNGTRLKYEWVQNIQKRLDGGEHVKLEDIYFGGKEGIKDDLRRKDDAKKERIKALSKKMGYEEQD